MSSYQSILQKIVARGKPVESKRVDNNTYAEKRGDNVAIRLHKTDIVTYTPDGRCILDTGGWKTVTTKARITDWAPMGVRVISDRGVWRLSYGRGLDSVPFVDGITLQLNDEVAPYFVPVEGTYPSAVREVQIAVAKKKLDKDIKTYAALIPAKAAAWAKELQEEGRLSTAGDCFHCQGIVTTMDGDVSQDTTHLWSHLREGYVFPSLVLVALADKGYRDPQYIVASDVLFNSTRLVKYVTQYLRKQLEPGQEPPVGVTDNAVKQWYVEQAVEVLEKPSDFGYFGVDEALWNTSAPTWTKHRDSSNEEVANFEVVLTALKAEFPELVPDDLDDEGFPSRSFNGGPAIYVFGAGHWAVGHIDQLVVPVKLDGTRPVDVDNLHPAFIRVCDFGRQVKDYPVLPGAEDIASRLDHEDHLNEAKQHLDDPTDENVAKLVKALTFEHDGFPEYLELEEWRSAVVELGLTPASWLDRYVTVDAE